MAGRKTLVPELRDMESRKALAEAVNGLLERWGLNPADRSALLAMKARGEPARDEPLPDDPAVLERAGHLLAIERALRRLYPYQPQLRDRWVSTAAPGLRGRPPIEVMLAGGVEGIRTVREVAEHLADTKWIR
jgi:hypothetical protein